MIFSTIEGDMRFALWIALTLLASVAFPQTVEHSKTHSPLRVWEPPNWDFPENVKASVPKQMFSTFRLSGYDITLEETSMKIVEKRLGGEIGAKGDAGDAVEWLCFHGAATEGAWVFWLESGEIDGGSVGSFQWQRLSSREVFDPRCHRLRGTASAIRLPLSLRLGVSKADVVKNLGEPTFADAGRLIYLHEHESTIKGEPFTTSNIVVVHLRKGIVWAIQASKTTSS
jgi:hypothetical protein